MSSDLTATKNPQRRRLAIIGGGSSGLICLKTAMEALPDWEVVCFERSGHMTGCWGNPYPGFVSTSTKYTTQFTCFPESDASVDDDAGQSRSEFFRNAEYGEYLTRFATNFGLQPHIKLRHQVARLTRAAKGAGWQVDYRATGESSSSDTISEHFDAVVICTGLAAHAKQIESTIPTLQLSQLNAPEGIANIRKQQIVIFGGGESAVDYATRLSQPDLKNKVYLSLRTGVRVSPRYHPIGGVPSDFLRNRLMLSVHPTMRNWIGQRFVEARILHQERFEKWFPARHQKAIGRSAEPEGTTESEEQCQALRKQWAYRLTKAAKDDLFNMFHNKSDDFLDAVGRGRIAIVGPPVDERLETYYGFESREQVELQPTAILPAIGYRSTLTEIAGDSIRLTDFYLGCCHIEHADLFLVGFARPIIGNIPTISEMQAQYVCGLIAGQVSRPARIAELKAVDQQANQKRFAKLNLDAIYPVEMFSYCDELARRMNSYPSLRSIGSLRSWWRMQLTPATTMHYQFQDPEVRRTFEQAPVYMPLSLILLLLVLKPFDAVYRVMQWLGKLCTAKSR